MAFFFVQFDQRSVNIQQIDPTAVDGMIGGLEYDEEIIEVPDASAFEADVSAYNASFGVYYGDPLPASDGKGEEPPPPLMAEMRVKQAPRRTKYDEWDTSKLKKKDIKELKAIHKKAVETNDYKEMFLAIERYKLSRHAYCCDGWKAHADYNMKKL